MRTFQSNERILNATNLITNKMGNELDTDNTIIKLHLSAENTVDINLPNRFSTVY